MLCVPPQCLKATADRCGKGAILGCCPQMFETAASSKESSLSSVPPTIRAGKDHFVFHPEEATR